MIEARVLISFNNALMAAWMKEPLCCKSKEAKKKKKKKKTFVELRRNKEAERQSRNRVAVVKTKYELLKTEQELKCWCQKRNKNPI